MKSKMIISNRYNGVMLTEPSDTRRMMLGKSTGYHIIKDGANSTYCGRKIDNATIRVYNNDYLLTECRACCGSLARELGITPESLRLHLVMGDVKAEAIEADIDEIVKQVSDKLKGD